MTCPLPSYARPAARVLLLQSFDSMPLTFGTFADTMRAELSRQVGGPVNFMQVSLQPTGFRSTPERPMLDYLRRAFTDEGQPDLVVTIGAPAALFVQRHLRELFVDVPVMLAAVDRRFVETISLPANVTAVGVTHDLSDAIANVLRLQPATTHLFVVLGTSAWEQSWQDSIQREALRLRSSLTLTFSSGMSIAQIVDHAAALPPHSVIFYMLFTVDAQGAAYDEELLLKRLHSVAHIPIFGAQTLQVGYGTVGGPEMDIEALGRQTAAVAVRILHGEPPGRIAPSFQAPGPPVFDWRELRRWGIDERHLPSGSIVRFREPSPWQRYKWLAGGTALIVGVEALLIVALVVNRTKKDRAQAALLESERRFRLLANAAPVMLWMSGTDKQCTDFNTTWLEFTGRTLEQELGDGWADGVHPDDLPHCLTTYSLAFNERQPFRMEYRLRRADGAYRWVLDVGVPRFMADASFAGYIGSAIDISEQRAAHAALSGLSGRLIDAQERERRRIARELHDDIAQRLALVSISLERPDLNTSSGEFAGQIIAIARDLQSLSHRLHSSKLEYLGLVSATAAFCVEASTQHGVSIEFTPSGTLEGLPTDTALALFRVLQEAVTNAIKHANSSYISVSLRGLPSGVQLEVADRGSGFDIVAARQGHGLGLVSMEERMKLVGGDVQLRAGAAGTVVRAFAPFTAAPDPTVASWGTTELAG
jgi:PAS domain S-box-containing protein